MIVTTYAGLMPFVQAFARGAIQLLILNGAPGVGKSETVKSILRDEGVSHHYQEGYVTKTEFVRLLYDHRDDPMILDDIDSLFAERSVYGILREAYDTTSERSVSYLSPTPHLQDIPKHFTVTGPLLIITNDIDNHPLARAFLSRAVVVHFQPTNDEITNHLQELIEQKKLPHDELVFDWFRQCVPVSKTPNYRAYVLSSQLKSCNIDWRAHLTASMCVQPLYADLLFANENGRTYKERSHLFAQRSGKSTRTYDRILREYRDLHGAP